MTPNVRQLANQLRVGVTLASPDIAADVAYIDSIMSLFTSGNRAPARMTR